MARGRVGNNSEAILRLCIPPCRGDLDMVDPNTGALFPAPLPARAGRDGVLRCWVLLWR